MQNNRDKNWKLLTREYVFKDKWLTVRKDSYELPTGAKIPAYYALEYPDWVNIIAITKDNRFVIIRQFRPGLGQFNYETCAGFCDEEDKSPLESAQRELLEETGYGNGQWELYMTISANPSTHTNLTYCYLAKNVEKIGQQHLDDSEDLSVYLLSYEEVKELLVNDEIKQALMAAPLWKYVAEHQ